MWTVDGAVPPLADRIEVGTGMGRRLAPRPRMAQDNAALPDGGVINESEWRRARRGALTEHGRQLTLLGARVIISFLPTSA